MFRASRPETRFKLILAVISLAGMASLYQNCSESQFVVASSTARNIDGLIFAAFGECGDRIGLKSEIHLSQDGANAYRLRADCADLPVPEKMEIKDLKFVSSGTDDSRKTLAFGGLLHDLQTGQPDQALTRLACRSTTVNGTASEASFRGLIRTTAMDDGASRASFQETFALKSSSQVGAWRVDALAVEFSSGPGNAGVYRSSATAGTGIEISVDASGNGTLRARKADGSVREVSVACDSQSMPAFLPHGKALVFTTMPESALKLRFAERADSEPGPETFLLKHDGTLDHFVATSRNFAALFDYHAARGAYASIARGGVRWNEGVVFSSPSLDSRLVLMTSKSDRRDVCFAREDDPDKRCVARYRGTLTDANFPTLSERVVAATNTFENHFARFKSNLIESCKINEQDFFIANEFAMGLSFHESATSYRFWVNRFDAAVLENAKQLTQGQFRNSLATCAPLLITQAKPEVASWSMAGIHPVWESFAPTLRREFKSMQSLFSEAINFYDVFGTGNVSTRSQSTRLRLAIYQAQHTVLPEDVVANPVLYSSSYVKPAFDLVGENMLSATCSAQANVSRAYGGWQESPQSCRQDSMTQSEFLAALSHFGAYLVSTGECQGMSRSSLPMTCARLRDSVLAGLAFVDRHLVIGTPGDAAFGGIREFPEGLGQGTPAVIDADRIVVASIFAFQFLNLVGVPEDQMVIRDFDQSTVPYRDLKARGLALIKKWVDARPDSSRWMAVAALRVNELANQR